MNGKVRYEDGRRVPPSSGSDLSTEEARSGATPRMTRYVLGWGLALVVIGFLAVLLYYMLNT